MTNATTPKPYVCIVLTGSFDIEKFSYPSPIEALLCALEYLRAGRQVRLSDRTVAALRESEELPRLDRLLAGLRNTDRVAGRLRATADVTLPNFTAAHDG